MRIFIPLSISAVFLISPHVTGLTWDDLVLDVDKALQAGEAHYEVAMIGGSPDKSTKMTMTGELILRTEEQDGKPVLADSTIIMGRTLQIDYTTDKTRYLYPSSITSRMLRNGEISREMTGRVADGKIFFKHKGTTQSIAFPKNTLTLTGLMRFMPQLPKEKGTRITISGFTSNFEIRVETSSGGKPLEIICQGLTEIEYNSAPIMAYTYELMNLRNELAFYVSQDNRLVQVRGGKDTIMSLMSPEQIKEAAAERAQKEKEQAEQLARIKEDIHEVSWRGWVDDTKRLLMKDPSLANQEDKNGDYPLNKAAKFGQDEIVKLLIEAKADVNRKNRFGSTPLHDTIPFEKVSTARILIEAGADLTIENEFGKTPLDQAREKGKQKMVEYLSSLPEN